MRYSLVIAAIFSLFLSKPVQAAIYGTEVFWECVNGGADSGKFIFKAKIYYDCNVWPMTSLNIKNPLYAKWGGQANIVVTRIGSIGYYTKYCYDSTRNGCAGFGQHGGYIIEVQEYRSAPVSLYGIPEITGSKFLMYLPASFPHTVNTLPAQVMASAIMYPLKDPATGKWLPVGTTSAGSSCYDNSPVFAEGPLISAPEGHRNVFSAAGIDPDFDELYSDWYWPESQGFIAPPGYKAYWLYGYDYKNQFPGKWMNPSNEPAVMDHSTGDVSFRTVFSSPSMHYAMFLTSHSIKSYRGGQIIAEVSRQVINMVFDTNAQLTYDSLPNVAPDIYFTLHNGKRIKGSGSDTIYLGDTLRLQILAVDSQKQDVNRRQKVHMMVNGSPLTKGSRLVFGKCLKPPCASIDTSGSGWNGRDWIDHGSVSTEITWVPNCDHLSMEGHNVASSRTFNFVCTAVDDFCSNPYQASATFSLTVIDTASRNIRMDTVIEDSSGIDLSWNKYSGSNFNNYYIYKSPSLYSSFELIDSISNVNQTTYRYLKNQKDTGIKHFYIKGDLLSSCLEQNIGSPLRLQREIIDHEYFKLTWNRPFTQTTGLQKTYNLYRSIDSSSWQLIAKVRNEEYIDSITQCGWYRYMIEYDQKGFYSISLPVSERISELARVGLKVGNSGFLSIRSAPGPYTIQWFKDGQPLAGETGDSTNLFLSGYYHAELTYSSGCISKSETYKNFTWLQFGYGSLNRIWIQYHPYQDKGSFKVIVLSADSLNGMFLPVDTLGSLGGYVSMTFPAGIKYFMLVKDSVNSPVRTSIIRNIHLEIDNAGKVPELIWNNPYPVPYIKRDYTVDLDSPVETYYTDTTYYRDTSALCWQSKYYRIIMHDSLDFLTWTPFENSVLPSVLNTKLLSKRDTLKPELRLFSYDDFDWYRSGALLPDTNSFHVVKSDGFYYLEMKNDKNCVIRTDTVYCNTFPIRPSFSGISTDTNGDVSLSWNSMAYLGSDFSRYEIFVSPDSLGPWNLLTSISGVNTTSYKHVGAGADKNEGFYMLRTAAYSDCQWDTILSDTLVKVGSNGVQVSHPFGGHLDIEWLPFYISRDKSGQNKYLIYRQYNSPSWTLIDSTQYGHEYLRDSVIGCDHKIHYRVDVDSAGVLQSAYGMIKVDTIQTSLLYLDSFILVTVPGKIHRWYLNGQIIVGSDSNHHTPQVSGKYMVVSIMKNGCVSVSNEVDIVITGIRNEKPMRKLSVYPNPSSGLFRIKLTGPPAKNLSYVITDARGKLVMQGSFLNDAKEEGAWELDLQSLSAGFYFLKMEGIQNETIKLIRN